MADTATRTNPSAIHCKEGRWGYQRYGSEKKFLGGLKDCWENVLLAANQNCITFLAVAFFTLQNLVLITSGSRGEGGGAGGGGEKKVSGEVNGNSIAFHLTTHSLHPLRMLHASKNAA